MRPLVRLLFLALVSGLVVMIGQPAQAALVLRDYTALPVPSVSQMLALTQTDQLVFASWQGDVAMMDRATGVTRTVPGTSGTGHLTSSDDGSHLYGATKRGGSITELEIGSLTARSWPVGGCPISAVERHNWVFYVEADLSSCSGWSRLMRLDPRTGETTTAGVSELGLVRAPKLVPLPGGNRFLVAEPGTSDSTAWVVDVADDGSIAVNATLPTGGTSLVTDEGDAVAIGDQLYSLPDLSPLQPLTASGTTSQVSSTVMTEHGAWWVNVNRRSDHGSINTYRRSDFYRAYGSGGPDIAFADARVVDGSLYAVANASDGTVRLYVQGSAAVPAAEVTITQVVPDPFYPLSPGQPIVVRGTVTDVGAPVEGAAVELSLLDPSQRALATVTTDDSGSWSYTFTPGSPGSYAFQASHTSDGRESADGVEFVVAKTPSTIELVEEPAAQPGETLTFAGRLSGGGVGLAERLIQWDLQCFAPPWYSVYPSLLTTTTGADGTFSITHTPRAGEVCETYGFNARWDGDADYLASEDWVGRPVAWHRSDLSLPLASTAYVQDEVTGVLTLTVDGVAAAGESVHLIIRRPDGTNAYEVDAITGADGTVPVSVVPTSPGTWSVHAQRSHTADTLGDSVSRAVSVTRVPTTLTLTEMTPSVEVGESVSINARIDRTDGRNGGAEVQLIATDSVGTRRDYFTTSTAAGSVDFVDVPSAGGSTRYSLLYHGDSRYLPTELAAPVVPVARHTPTVTLRTDRTSYNVRQTATIRVNVSDSETRHVVVTAKRAGLDPLVLFDGVVPANGLALTRTMWHSETITVRHPGDDRHTTSSSSLWRGVRLGMTTTATRPVERIGRYAVYRRTADPTFVTATGPRRPGICVRLNLQKYNGSTWRTIRTSACRTTGSLGKARWTLTGTQPVGVRFRTRGVFSGDRLNIASNGTWTHFRFR